MRIENVTSDISQIMYGLPQGLTVDYISHVTLLTCLVLLLTTTYNNFTVLY